MNMDVKVHGNNTTIVDTCLSEVGGIEPVGEQVAVPHRLRAATMSSLWDGYGKGKLSVHGNQGRHCCQRSLAHAKAPTPSRKQAPPGRSHRMNSTSDQLWGGWEVRVMLARDSGCFIFSESQRGFSGSPWGFHLCQRTRSTETHLTVSCRHVVNTRR